MTSQSPIDSFQESSNSDSALEPPPIPPFCFERFIIEREIGRGFGSVVYRAIDPNDQSVVALKVLYPGPRSLPLQDLVRQANDEAQKLRSLSHPHIIGFREVGVHEGRAFLVTPFVAGKSLDQVLAAGALDKEQAIRLMIKVATAVHHAHESGLIHRDLKPPNIVVGTNGEPYLLDFGLSWWKGQKGDEGIQTIAGTPAFMSPEQIRGVEQKLKPSTDVYSLGAILYVVLTGRLPHKADSPWKTMQMTLHTTPQPPRQIHSTVNLDLERIALSCLEKNPRKRYPSALAMAKDLERVLSGKGAEGPQPSLIRRIFR